MTDTPFPIKSEEVEPFAAMVVGRLFARCQAAKEKGPTYHEDALMSLWYTLHGLEKIAVGVRTATHFSLAMNNHISMIARHIKSETGIDPDTHPDWKWPI